MNITYKTIKDLPNEQLYKLFSACDDDFLIDCDRECGNIIVKYYPQYIATLAVK